jgi:hypothetical protein
MVYIIGSYMSLVIPVLTLIVAWRFANWRKWREYYSTILFTIVVDFSISLLTYNHSLWHYGKTLFLPNHTLTDITLNFFHYPFIILLYLSRYPYESRTLRQLAHIALFVVVLSLIESMFMQIKLITYHNGWNYWWSIPVWLSMFIVARLHLTRPLWAWLSFFGGTVFLVWYFHLPINKLK